MRAFLLCLTGVLALSGCRSIWDPTFQPAGYSYHRNEFKSPPGPPAADIGYDYTADKNQQVQNEWRAAIDSVMTKAMNANIGIPQNVAIVTDLDKSAFQGTYESLLRDNLRANGLTLVDEKTLAPDAPRLFYSAYGEKTAAQLRQARAQYNGDMPPSEDTKFEPVNRQMELVVGVIKNGLFVNRVSEKFNLQVYGYPEGVNAYRPGHERPVQAVDKTPRLEETLN